MNLSGFWAITSFFNSAGYRRKLLNFRTFRQRIALPLLAVEYSHEGNFELTPADADRLIQIRGGSIMWQKERLLNIALQNLPAECDYVAWIDADVILTRPDWPAVAMEEMKGRLLIQLFHRVCHLGPNAGIDPLSKQDLICIQQSFGFAKRTMGPLPLRTGNSDTLRRLSPGYAWCARREILSKHGFYDRSIVGGGDSLMAYAAGGQAPGEVQRRTGQGEMTAGHGVDYLRWATDFHRDFRSIGVVEGELYHLWHGDLLQRGYQRRKAILVDHGYDPLTDIAIEEQGCWRWSSHKPEMHKQVRDYFNARDEDGERSGLPEWKASAAGRRS